MTCHQMMKLGVKSTLRNTHTYTYQSWKNLRVDLLWTNNVEVDPVGKPRFSNHGWRGPAELQESSPCHLFTGWGRAWGWMRFPALEPHILHDPLMVAPTTQEVGHIGCGWLTSHGNCLQCQDAGSAPKKISPPWESKRSVPSVLAGTGAVAQST